MSQLVRVQQKIFGSTGPTTEFAQIGSLAAAAVLKTKDLTQIQALGQYDAGLYAITNSASEPPRIQDLNSLYFMTTTQMAYMFQTGIPEWETNTEYYQNVGYVQKAGVLYRSTRASVNQGIDPASDGGINWGGPLMVELTSTGQTILARDGGDVIMGGSLSGGSKVTVFGIGQTTSTILDSGNHDDTISLYTNSSAGGSGGVLAIGNVQSRSAGVIGWAALKGILLNGSGNTQGDLGFFIRNINTDIELQEVMRIKSSKNLLIGTTVDSGPRLVVAADSGPIPTISGSVAFMVHKSGSTTQPATISIISGNTGNSSLFFGDTDSDSSGQIRYAHLTDSMQFVVNAAEKMRLTSANHLLLNTTSDPGETLHVNGSARFTGSSGNVIISDTGTRIDATSTNFALRCSTVGGGLRFITNARGNSVGESNLVCNSDQSVTINTTLLVDTISEKTASAGVSIDSDLNVNSGNTVSAINLETNSGAGYTSLNFLLAGVLKHEIRSNVATNDLEFRVSGASKMELTSTGVLQIDTISEKTASAGVSVDSVLLKDGYVAPTKGVQITKNHVESSSVTNANWFNAFSPFLVIGIEVLCIGFIKFSGLDFYPSKMEKTSSTAITVRGAVPGVNNNATITFNSSGAGATVEGNMSI